MKEYKIVENLPDFLKGIKEFQIIADMINPELELFRRRVQNALMNKCISDMDTDGISRMEKSLKITPLKTDTLEDRRFRLKLYENGDRPYTEDTINERLKKICGDENAKISVDTANYLFDINVGDTSGSRYNEIMKLIIRVMPCNMCINISMDIESAVYIGGYISDREYGYSIPSRQPRTYADLQQMTYEEMQSKTYSQLLYEE